MRDSKHESPPSLVDELTEHVDIFLPPSAVEALDQEAARRSALTGSPVPREAIAQILLEEWARRQLS
jgi:hypothetical protein